MKLNKKGFMLAEVVIVAAVISGILVALYISVNRMSHAYDTRNRYYDIDAMYAAMNINDEIKRNNTIYNSNSPTNIISAFVYSYNSITSHKIKAYYVPLSPETTSIELANVDEYFTEYIEYLNDNIKFSNYKYLIIVELQKKDADDVYFYTLKVEEVGD